MNTLKIRPHLWISGPDPVAHAQYNAWLKHKSQAAYRGEPHRLEFSDWQYFWNQDDNWLNRGRKNSDLVLTRRDHSAAWSRENCHIMSRGEHLVKMSSLKRGTKYRTRQTV
jgi:hypothetical protein